MRKILISSLAAAGLASAGSANAAVVLGELTGGSAFNNGGVFQQLDPGPGFTVGRNNQQSNNLFAFDELQGVTLTSAIGGLAAGTVVNSHYVFFDPRPSRRAIGYVDFDSEILSVLDTRSAMRSTDALLGDANVTYRNPRLRGLENVDNFSVAGNRLDLSFRASSPGDYVRVLTASAVPEPESWAMMILGFGLVGGAMRRRRKISTQVSYA